MKLILSLRNPQEPPSQQTLRLYLPNLTTTQQLSSVVAQRLGVQQTQFVMRVRVGGVLVKVIDGWQLQHYRITTGKMLYTELLPGGGSTSKDRAHLKDSIGRQTKQQDSYAEPEETTEQKLQKLLEDQLNMFINAVETGSLEQCKRIMATAPVDWPVTQEKALETRNNFLIKQLYSTGVSALHRSVTLNQLDISEWLMEQGSNVNCCSSQDWTPLQLAVHYQTSAELLRTLLKHPDIDLDLVTSRGTALHVAALGNNRAAIRLLLDHGADELVKNAEGFTADHLASDSKCKQLIRKGRASIISPDKTPASVHGFIGVVRSIFNTVVQMYLVLQPHQGVLKFHKSESEPEFKPLHSIRLEDITQVRIVQKKKWWMKKEMFYVEIRFGKRMRYLVAKYQNIAVKWAICIRNARDAIAKNSQLDQGQIRLMISSKTNQIIVQGKNSNTPNQRRATIQRKGPKQYTTVKQLGRGSFAKVYLVRHNATGQLFAMKVIQKQPLIESEQLKYAYGQIQILKALCFPFIVELVDNFETSTHIHLVLEYCPYGDLSEYLAEMCLIEKTSRVLIAQVILAVGYLHQKKVLYRDLKPQNILISKAGYLKLADFGLSIKPKDDMLAKTFCGSPVYTCPELLQNLPYSPASDIYGIGCLLYEMFTGDPPFYSDNLAKLYDKILNGDYRLSDKIPQSARSLIRMLLNRKPNSRPTIQVIKKHEFFKGFQWEKMIQMKYNGLDKEALDNCCVEARFDWSDQEI